LWTGLDEIFKVDRPQAEPKQILSNPVHGEGLGAVADFGPVMYVNTV